MLASLLLFCLVRNPLKNSSDKLHKQDFFLLVFLHGVVILELHAGRCSRGVCYRRNTLSYKRGWLTLLDECLQYVSDGVHEGSDEAKLDSGKPGCFLFFYHEQL